MVKAVFINCVGGVDKLEYSTDFPKPTRKPGQVLIKTVSIGVNPVDAIVRNGGYAPEKFPKVLGGDVAGTVEEADEGSRFKVGDAVAALTPGFLGSTPEGTYIEYVAADEAWLAHVPTAALPLEQAAGLPLVGLTALQALLQATPQPGQRILIHAASGGVGHVAVQLAKAKGLYVIAVAGPKNVEFVKGLGADEVIDYSTHDWVADLQPNPVDIVLDTRGTRGDDLQKSLKVLKPTGFLAHIFNAGTDGELLQKLGEAYAAGDGPAVGTTLVAPNGEQLQELLALVESGKIKLTVSESLPLQEAAKAHELIEGGHTRGKIVLLP